MKKAGRAAKRDAPGPSVKKRVKLKPILIAIIGLVVVAALVIVYVSLPKNTECQTLEACITQADEMQRQQNPEGAIAAYGRAVDMVPPQDHMPNAWILCNRADLLEQVGRHDEAVANRDMCMVWQRGE